MVLKLFPGYEILVQISSFLGDITTVSAGDSEAKEQQSEGKLLEADSYTKRTIEIIKPIITSAFFYLNNKISEDQYQRWSELLPEELRGPSKKEYLKQKARIVNLQQEVLSNARSIDGLKMKMDSQCEELEEKTNKIASLEVDIVTKKMKICCLKSTSDSQTEQISKLKHTIEEFEKKVKSLDADIAQKAREIARLKSETERLSNEVESKTAKVSSLSTELIKKTNQILQMEVETVSDKKMWDEGKEKELESLCAEIDSWKVLVKVRDSEVAILRSEAQNRDEEIQDKNNNIVNLTKDIQYKDALISKLKIQKITSLDKPPHDRLKSDELISKLSSTMEQW